MIKAMKNRIFSCRILLLFTLWAFFFLPLKKIFAYPVGANGWHLNSVLQTKSNADLVCKIKVLSVRTEGVTQNPYSITRQDMSQMIATSRVLSVIKGECPEVLDIEYYYPKDRGPNSGFPFSQFYAELSEDEICIVFLKKSEPYYKLNRISSKARVQPKVVDYDLGDTPVLRLVAEFVAGCNSADEMAKLQAMEELGYLGKEMVRDLGQFRSDKERFDQVAFGLSKAKQALRRTRSSKNLVIRNVSIISSFLADDSPGIEAPLELLRLDPNKFDQTDSMKKYGIRDFSISSLQLRLLETMDAATRRSIVDLKNRRIGRIEGRRGIFRGVRDFNYAEFFRQALDCEAVNNSQMRKSIANVIWIRYEEESVPEMIRLLDDPDISIRQTAMSALRKCINSDLSNSWTLSKDGTDFGPPEDKPLEERQNDYENNEQQYIQHWKKWWKENIDRFKSIDCKKQ